MNHDCNAGADGREASLTIHTSELEDLPLHRLMGSFQAVCPIIFGLVEVFRLTRPASEMKQMSRLGVPTWLNQYFCFVALNAVTIRTEAVVSNGNG